MIQNDNATFQVALSFLGFGSGKKPEGEYCSTRFSIRGEGPRLDLF
jgi:hypothetical protein